MSLSLIFYDFVKQSQDGLFELSRAATSFSTALAAALQGQTILYALVPETITTGQAVSFETSEV